MFTYYNSFVDGDWESIIRIMLKIKSTAGTIVNVALISVEAINLPGVITINFDDGYTNSYDIAKPIMDKYGLTAVLYVVTDFVGTTGYCTLQQLKDLQNTGWLIASHGKSHFNLTALGDADIRTQLGKARIWLKNNGFHKGANFFAAPFGAYDKTKIPIYFEYYKAFRAVSGLAFGTENYNTLPHMILENYPMPSYKSVLNNDATSTLTGLVDECIEKGLWHNMVFHKIVTPASSTYQYTPTDFETVMAYIAQKRDDGQLLVLKPNDIYYQTDGPVMVDNGEAVMFGVNGKVPILYDLEI